MSSRIGKSSGSSYFELLKRGAKASVGKSPADLEEEARIDESLREERAARKEQMRREWFAAYQPNDPICEMLVEMGAKEADRLRECRSHVDWLRIRVGEFGGRSWNAEETAKVKRLVSKLASEPDYYAPELKRTMHGVQWLHDRWTELGGRLEKGIPWTEDEQNLALDMLGVPAELRGVTSPVGIRGANSEILAKHRRELVRDQLSWLKGRIKYDRFLYDAIRAWEGSDESYLERLQRFEEREACLFSCVREFIGMINKLQGRKRNAPVPKVRMTVVQLPPRRERPRTEDGEEKKPLRAVFDRGRFLDGMNPKAAVVRARIVPPADEPRAE